MNVRKYGSPAPYVPNNKADKRWKKKQKYAKPLGERPETKMKMDDVMAAMEWLKKKYEKP